MELMIPKRNPKPEQVQAGVNRLDMYGWIGTIDTLAGGDLTRWDAIMTVSYERTMTKIAMNRDKDMYQERLGEILKSKQDRINKPSYWNKK